MNCQVDTASFIGSTRTIGMGGEMLHSLLAPVGGGRNP
jgi:hypothetical protein